MLRKALQAVELKAADGSGRAIFSRYSVVDSDGDVTLPGAFTDGVVVPVSAWGHSSWQGALPIGVATVRDRGGWAEAHIDFFDTASGQDHRETLKALGPLGQWSYGFDVLDYSFGDFGGQQVRFLKKLQPHEVSPVLVGAGVNTTTVDVRSAERSTVVGELRRFIDRERCRQLATIRDNMAGAG